MFVNGCIAWITRSRRAVFVCTFTLHLKLRPGRFIVSKLLMFSPLILPLPLWFERSWNTWERINRGSALIRSKWRLSFRENTLVVLTWIFKLSEPVSGHSSCHKSTFFQEAKFSHISTGNWCPTLRQWKFNLPTWELHLWVVFWAVSGHTHSLTHIKPNRTVN